MEVENPPEKDGEVAAGATSSKRVENVPTVEMTEGAEYDFFPLPPGRILELTDYTGIPNKKNNVG